MAEDSAAAQDKVVEDIAVSMWGKAITDPQHGKRTPKTYIGGLKPGNQSIANAAKAGCSPRTTIDFTEEELDPKQDLRYLVIGYAYPDAAEADKLAKNSTEHAVGIVKNPYIELVDLEGEVPWIVVAPVGDTRGQVTPFFVLTEPTENGLCQPLPIKKELIFFFHEYRDATTGGDGRKNSWSSKVLADCGKPVSAPLTQKQKSYAAARSNAVGPVPGFINLDTTMHANHQLFEATGERRALKLMLQDLQKVAKDIRLAPSGHNNSLRAFIDPESEFGDDQAHDLLRRFKVGPQVSANTVLQLRKVTVSSDDFVEYRILCLWLGMLFDRLKDVSKTEDLTTMDDERMKHHALEVRYFAGLADKSMKHKPIDISEEDTTRILLAVARKLKELSKVPEALVARLGAMAGNPRYAEGTTMSSIWERFGGRRDVDSAKKLFLESLGFVYHLMEVDVAQPLAAGLLDLREFVEKAAGV